MNLESDPVLIDLIADSNDETSAVTFDRALLEFRFRDQP